MRNPCRTCRHFDGAEHPFGPTHGRCAWLASEPTLPYWVRFESYSPSVPADFDKCGSWEAKP